MSNIANELTQKAKDLFQVESRDLLALTKNGAHDAFKRIAAALILDTQAQSDCLLYADILDQPSGYARDQARDDFRNAMLVAICKAYLKIQRNGVVSYVAKLTPEAQEQLELVEIMAGERAPRVVVPTAPPKTAAEMLTEEVLRDWKFLPVDKVRHKMNNRAYKAEFDRLDAANLLETQITSLTDGSKI